jgi:hypothetical protein
MLGQAQASELRVIRWWMFEGDAWQIARDASGAPTEVNPAVYADIDAALQLAAANGVVYDFVLFSGPTAIPSAWMTDPAQRAKLASALAPLFAHYRDNPYVWSWEVVNEPEWDIWKHEIQQEAVQATVKDVAAAVHGNSSARVTVGSAMLDGLSMWVGQGLDYYQAHWYDHMSGGNWCAICTDYAAVKSRYSLDAPLVIGEFYAGKDVAALQRETYFETHGYGGAWAWSLSSDRTNDHLTVNMAAAQAFASGQRDAGSPAGAAAPAVSAGTPTFKTGASGTPALGGEAESISIVVMSDATTSALVDAELYSPAGDKLYQQAFDNQAFVAGKSRTFTAMWHRPSSAPAGIYIVKVGVFSPGWGTMYDWNDHAADALIGPARP